jgi:hypothetical protein
MTEPAYACSLTDGELAARRREWRALEQRALLRTESRPDGRLIVYRGTEETARVLAALIESERQCCPFLHFTVDREEEEVRVTIGVSPEAREHAVELGIVESD